jgi:hypothetical protein
MKSASVERNLPQVDLETENARLQRLVAELLKRNQQLRLKLEFYTSQS